MFAHLALGQTSSLPPHEHKHLPEKLGETFLWLVCIVDNYNDKNFQRETTEKSVEIFIMEMYMRKLPEVS